MWQNNFDTRKVAILRAVPKRSGVIMISQYLDITLNHLEAFPVLASVK